LNLFLSWYNIIVMDLKRYRGEGGCAPRNNLIGVKKAPGNRFVIQEHKATGFDFKLEIKNEDDKTNVLHSWVIPKNIPLELEVKHLAIKVANGTLEPSDYKQGNAKGASEESQSKVWDKGRWGLMKGNIKDGVISFNLFGEIIKARYKIQKLENNKDNNQKNHWIIWRVTGYE